MFYKCKLKILLLASTIALLFSCTLSCKQISKEETIVKLAKSYNCIIDKKHNVKNEKGTKPPFLWNFLKLKKERVNVIFICNYIEEEKIKNKIIVHIQNANDIKTKNPFEQCSREIKNIQSQSTGIWVENNVIVTGFEDGFYYMCKNGKWVSSFWH